MTFNLADYYLFDRLEEGLGGTPAILFGQQVHSYASVAAHTRQLSAFLIAAGVTAERRVLIILPDTPAFAWALFATLTAGAVVAMGNPDAPPDQLDDLVRYTRAGAVITTPEVAAALGRALDAAGTLALIVAARVATGDDVLTPPAVLPPAAMSTQVEVVTLAEALHAGEELLAAGRADRRPTEPDDPAIWLFTSGSTGRSKAAMHAHRDFAFNTERYAIGTVGYRRGDVTVSVPRLFFGYATGTNLMFPFRVGGTTGLFAERPTPASLADAIVRYRPTVITNVPTMMGKLLADDDERVEAGEPRLDLSSVRFHLSAGEALPPALLARFTERFGAEVYDGIGSAEMFHIYCSNRPGDVMPGSLGRAVDGYTLAILPVDADGPGCAPVPAGQTGVMWVKGDSVAMGYFQDRDQSWQTFHGHWCRTGDLFRIDAEGYCWFEGRADDLLKVGGVWVAPVEVERCLVAHPAVSQAAVLGALDEEGLTKPKAFVVLQAHAADEAATAVGRETLIAALQAHVKASLHKHKYPRWVVFVDELPRNDRGKIDRRALAREPGHS